MAGSLCEQRIIAFRDKVVRSWTRGWKDTAAIQTAADDILRAVDHATFIQGVYGVDDLIQEYIDKMDRYSEVSPRTTTKLMFKRIALAAQEILDNI